MNTRRLFIATLTTAVGLWTIPVFSAEQGGGAPLAAKLGWRPAAPVPGFTTRAPLSIRPTLEETLAERPPTAAVPEREPKSRTVVLGQSYPAKYRPMIRRYFELIRGPR